MNARTKKLLPVIIGGGLFVGWRAFAVVNRYPPARAAAEVVQPDMPAQPLEDYRNSSHSDDLSATLEAQRAMEDRGWGRDPFDAMSFEPKVRRDETQGLSAKAQAPAKPPPAPTIAFSGVSKSADRWLAAVNGAIVRVGDVVQEKYEVVTISKSSITLAAEGWMFRYELGSKVADVRRRESPSIKGGDDRKTSGTSPAANTENP